MPTTDAITAARNALHSAQQDFTFSPGLAAKERLDAARKRLIELVGAPTTEPAPAPWNIHVTVPR